MKYLSLKVPGYGKFEDPTGLADKPDILSKIINTGLQLFVAIGVILAIVFLIIGAISWIASGGEKEKLERARKTVVFSIVGLIVIILSFLIINVIGTLLGSRVLQEL